MKQAKETAKPICERIAEKIINRRQALRLTLQELADRTGLSKTYVWELEQGESEPGAGVVVRLCRALGVTADELLGVGESVDG